MESRAGYAGWGDRGLQCEGEGYTDCTSGSEEIWGRVSSAGSGRLEGKTDCV